MGSDNGFRDTNIGPMPQEWDVVELGTLSTRFHGGGTPSTKKQEYWNGDIPWTTSAYIDNRLYLTKSAGYITQLGLRNSSSQLVPRGNLLIGTRVGVGKVAINAFDTAISQDLTGMHVNHAVVHVEFLAYALKADFCQERFSSATRGTTIKGIPRDDLVKIPVPLPPMAEQRRIAAVLNTIQEAIAAQEDVIAAARAFKRSLMHRLFTYGPGPVPAETKETLYGEIPAHWPTELLSDCAYVQTGTAKGRRFSPADTVIDVPYLRVANVQDGFLDLSEIKTITIRENEFDRYKLEPGDVLMTEGGDFDKLGRGFIWRGEIDRCIHQNHVFAVRVNRDVLLPEWLAYLTQSGYGKSYFLTVAHRTTNLASINTTKLKALPVLVPPLDEQAEVVDMLQAADDKLAAEEDRKAALEALFKSMLHQLMTGQMRLLRDEGLPLPN